MPINFKNISGVGSINPKKFGSGTMNFKITTVLSYNAGLFKTTYIFLINNSFSYPMNFFNSSVI
jgi:hypothetical protein